MNLFLRLDHCLSCWYRLVLKRTVFSYNWSICLPISHIYKILDRLTQTLLTTQYSSLQWQTQWWTYNEETWARDITTMPAHTWSPPCQLSREPPTSACPSMQQPLVPLRSVVWPARSLSHQPDSHLLDSLAHTSSQSTQLHTTPGSTRPQPVGSDCAHTQDKLTGLKGFQSVRYALLRTSNVIKDLDHLLENNDFLSCSALSTSIFVIKAYKHIYAHLSFNTVKVLVKSHITR